MRRIGFWAYADIGTPPRVDQPRSVRRRLASVSWSIVQFDAEGSVQQTAAELWDEWVRSGALRPRDYDTDVELRVRHALEPAGTTSTAPLGAVMDAAGWKPRDLVHSLAPLVSSFAGMLRDLLRLLSRVGARSGTGEGLRVVYEFDEHDRIDESLEAFRETVERVESVVVRIRPLVFDPAHAWHSPLLDFRSDAFAAALTSRSRARGRERWPFAADIPGPVPTGSQRVDALLERYMKVIRLVTERLSEIGDDTIAVRAWLELVCRDPDPEAREADPTLVAMAGAAMDYWPLDSASAVHGFADRVVGGVELPEGLLDELDVWLASFWGAEQEESQEQLVQDLTDVLSLPTWGKRHELYSAWIATQIDRALDPSRLDFVVNDGALRFPFRPTLLARLDPPDGDLELWSEVRSPAYDLAGKGRKGAVQPDYRFIRTSDGVTVVAVEVKQYLRSATRNPADALRDYVTALPDAEVLLVAHGPLGARVLDAVPVAERQRARVYRNVRVGRPLEEAAFRADVSKTFVRHARVAAFPAGAARPAGERLNRPTRIELRWDPSVQDLDLHVRAADAETSWQNRSTPHSTLRADAFEGGPEIIDVDAATSVAVEVRVHVYSLGTLRDAGPVVAFTWGDGTCLELDPSDEFMRKERRWWRVARIGEDGAVAPSCDSRIAGPPPVSR